MASSIYNPDFCMKSTLEAVRESGMPPGNIVLEVVESDLVRDPATPYVQRLVRDWSED